MKINTKYDLGDRVLIKILDGTEGLEVIQQIQFSKQGIVYAGTCAFSDDDIIGKVIIDKPKQKRMRKKKIKEEQLSLNTGLMTPDVLLAQEAEFRT